LATNAWSLADLLPGAAVLLFAALLVAALRRWYDPVPRPTLLAFAVVVAILFCPVLVGGGVLLPLGNLTDSVPFRHLPPPEPPSVGIQGDNVVQILPWQAQVRRAIEAGRWPLWNGLAGAGMPLMGDPQSQSFQPLVLVSYPVALRHAPAVTGALKVLVALLGVFLFLRRQGLGAIAATLGGVAWGCGGVLLWLGWPLSTPLAMAPWALYAVVRCHQAGGRRDFALLGAVFFVLLLAGHPETVIYALAAAAVVGLACLVERRRNRRPLAPLIVGCVVAGVLAAAAAAPVLVTVQGFLPTTERAAVIGFMRSGISLGDLWDELQQPGGLAAWADRVGAKLSPFVAPRARGSFEDGYWGHRNYFETAPGFAGTGLLILAIAGLARARLRFAQERWLQGLAAFGLLIVAQPPGFDRLIGPLPLLGATAAHQNQRLAGFVGLAILCLAACELERWLRGERRWWPLGGATVAVVGLLFWGYLAYPRPGGAGELFFLEARALRLQLVVASLTVGLVAAGARLSRRNGRAGLVAGAMVVVVAAAELLLLHAPTARAAPARLFYPRLPPLRFIAQHLDGARFTGFGRAMPPNYAQVYGLPDIRIDGPSRPMAYARVLSTLQKPGPLPMPDLFYVSRPRHPVNDLLGVRYVLASATTELDLPVAFSHRAGKVFERPTALPRLFLPAAADVVEPGLDWVSWIDRNPSFLARALVPEGPRFGGGAGEASDPRKPWRARRPRASSLQLELRGPERLAARLDLAERRLLASSVLADPGWRLLLDGEPRPTIVANGPFVAAWLPKGQWRVELLYRPRGFLAACAVAAAGLAAALCLLTRPPPDRARAA
jgi:hypothetical protein